MNFRELLKQEPVNEEISEINSSGIGYIITEGLALVAQSHIWHLLIKSGQKHTALGEFYSTLDTELDELAERFIAQGGQLSNLEITLNTNVDELSILQNIDNYRSIVSTTIANIESAELESMKDGLIDLQECIDSFTYKFKLN